MKHTRHCAALGAVLLCGTTHVATAALIPPEALIPASFSGTMLFNLDDPPRLDVQSFGLHTLHGAQGDARLDSGILASPFIHASVPRVNDGAFGRVVGTAQYDVVLDGLDASVLIHVQSAGEVQGSASDDPLSGAGYALNAGWRIENVSSGETIFDESVKTPGQVAGTFFDSFDHIVDFNLLANTLYRVTMIADVGIANGQTNGAFGFGLAFIDPVFSVDDPDYSFRFSDGVGNTRGDTGGGGTGGGGGTTDPVPVPEPGTFALFLAALLPLRLLRRRPA